MRSGPGSSVSCRVCVYLTIFPLPPIVASTCRSDRPSPPIFPLELPFPPPQARKPYRPPPSQPWRRPLPPVSSPNPPTSPPTRIGPNSSLPFPPPAAAGPQQRRLLKAAADGDLGRFKSIASALDGGKGCVKEAVEAARDAGSGALHAAARHGRMPVCVYLVEQLGVNVDAADDKGDTPLMYALGWGNLDIVRYLLDHDADPEKPGEHGATALHVAAGAGMCEMIEVLLSKGADVNSVSFCGTPLHAAIIGKHDAAVKTLLNHHADCNKAMGIHYTPLVAAIHICSLKCVKLLIKAGADVKGVGPLTPLIAAASDGLTDFYKPLLAAGADPDVRDDVRKFLASKIAVGNLVSVFLKDGPFPDTTNGCYY
ncbi:ankyrin-1-like [Triticum urartu]|uniref:ankyrin-1-like n=1 Tax=Triticum urartu TaxID=4572 RepID=UPI002043FA16|nr:ankyrin-1-like [Triticum urartu]